VDLGLRLDHSRFLESVQQRRVVGDQRSIPEHLSVLINGQIDVFWLGLRGFFRTLGNSTGTVCVITGIVIMNTISNTNMTSTSGVVLIVEFSSASSPSAGPTFIAICAFLWNFGQGL
jgi:hypothetical protein